MSYVNYISYVSYMSYVFRLYELYELCKLHEYFMNCLKSPKIALNLIFLVF